MFITSLVHIFLRCAGPKRALKRKPRARRKGKPDDAYRLLLADPRWQRRRLEIMARDKFQCRRCGAGDKTLHVHHVKYFKKRIPPWEYPAKLLITVCEDCHEILTVKQRKARRFFRATQTKRQKLKKI